MADPLYANGVGLAVIVIDIVKVLVAFGALLVAVMLMIWFERKVISDMQNRIGPNRAGPFGILQTLADGVKLFFKEELFPERADRMVYKLAPYLALIPALLIFTVVPVGGIVHIAGHTVLLQVAELPMGGSSSSSPCPRSPSTGPCSPAGPPAPSTRCSGRCGRAPR
jgi:NADH-quinone oxidoreductase subunit H